MEVIVQIDEMSDLSEAVVAISSGCPFSGTTSAVPSLSPSICRHRPPPQSIPVISRNGYLEFGIPCVDSVEEDLAWERNYASRSLGRRRIVDAGASPQELDIVDAIKGDHGSVLYAMTFAFFCGLTAITLFSPIMNQMNRHLKLSPTQKQLVNIAPTISGSILRLVSGIFVEKYTAKAVIKMQLLLTLLGNFAVLVICLTMYPDGFSEKLMWPFIICGLVAGAGIATFSTGISTLSMWSEYKFMGRSLGFLGGFGNLSPAIFSLVLPYIAKLLSIPAMYSIWFIWLCWGSYVAVKNVNDSPFTQMKRMHQVAASLDPSTPPFNKERAKELSRLMFGQQVFPTGEIIAPLVNSAKHLHTWILAAIYFVSFGGGFLGMFAYLPTYYLDAFGSSDGVIAICVFSFALLASALRYPAGILADDFGCVTVGYFSFICCLLGAFVFSISTSFSFSYLGLILSGCGVGLINGCVFKAVPLLCADYMTGASSWTGCIGAMGGFAFPVVFATISNNSNSYRLPWSAFLVPILLCIPLWAILAKPLKHKTLQIELDKLQEDIPGLELKLPRHLRKLTKFPFPKPTPNPNPNLNVNPNSNSKSKSSLNSNPRASADSNGSPSDDLTLHNFPTANRQCQF